MSERDPMAILLRELDRPATPRPEFADELLEQLLAELESLPVPPAPAHVRRLRFAPRRRLLLAFALAVLGTAIAIVVVTRPQKASALGVIQQARRAFATAPPFQATLRVDLNPDGSLKYAPKGATATVEVSYGGPKRFRTTLVSEHPPVRGANVPGSFQVFDGKRVGTFDPRQNTFFSFAGRNFQPLEFLSWKGAFPNWEEVCRRGGSKVLPSARIAGRDAQHIRCGDYRGGFWELWIDRGTGLLLKIVGQVGGDDLGVLGGLGSSTSPKGGFDVEQLRYNPSFPAGTFEVAAPKGTFDYQGRLRAAIAKVPPFSAVVYARSGAGTYVNGVWWLSNEAWRRNVVVGHREFGGPGSFLVQAHGSVRSYNARDNSYSNDTFSEAASPVLELLPENDPRYSTTSCPIVGHDQIAGRAAVHRRCKTYDVWVDGTTGIALRKHARGFELRVRSIDYHPAFPPGTFQFVPPAGSRNAQQLAGDPYYKTKLAPGKVAPNWSAPTLGGGTFQVADLRGKPALLLLFSDTCPPGDPACDVFASLKRVYQQWKSKVAFVWVDFQGSAEQARKIVQHNHLTVPVVIDGGFPGAVFKTWSIQGYPYWLLLDSHGRVIEARLKPQTVAQLQQLLAKSK